MLTRRALRQRLLADSHKRWTVVRLNDGIPGQRWVATDVEDRGFSIFLTFAEAIAYADKEARK